MITCYEIKKIVEGVSSENDISVNSRKGRLPHLRYVYYGLCVKYESYIKVKTLQHIGSIVKRDHASVLHGLKQFEKVKEDNYHSAYDLFLSCCEEINILLANNSEIKSDNLKDYYKFKTLALQSKYRAVINNLRSKIKNLESSNINHDFVKKISKLSNEDLDELNDKFDVFIKVKNKLNENHNKS